jgi:hypothetical protein
VTTHHPDDVARFFDSRSEGHVYARDNRLAPEAPLAYMPVDAADLLREDSRSGHYRCVLPRCAMALTAVGGRRRRHHWRHPTGIGAHAPESIWHRVSKEMLFAWAREQIPHADVRLDDKRTVSGRQPDVWVR